jgi:nucleoside-diphosphate-sugar epimerase
MKIFLAGASGVIGRNLIPRLVGAGHQVVGMTLYGPGMVYAKDGRSPRRSGAASCQPTRT